MIVHFLKCVHYRRLFNNAGAPGELLQCANYVRGGDTVLDLGANIGIYSKHLSAMVGLSGQVHAVELMPETCSYLLGNVRDLATCSVTTLVFPVPREYPMHVSLTVYLAAEGISTAHT